MSARRDSSGSGWRDASARQVDLRFHVSLAERFRRADTANPPISAQDLCAAVRSRYI